MRPCNLRSLLLAAIVLNCITWTVSRHHYTHHISGHRNRHRRQGAGLYLSASYALPGGEGTGWGEWGEVTPCSRTCGVGVASQKRICLQVGSDGQPMCTGGDTKFFSCQTQDCPPGTRDFRAEQCSEFDSVLVRGIKYKWEPYLKAPNPCELNCMPHGERFYYRHKAKVIDGTRCNSESFDVCVNGTCQSVGCDMMLGSNAREDKCLECRGNGANCHTISGVLDTQDIRKGYNDMLLIPQGATSIIIMEVAPSRNYLALRAKNGTYYLNGDYHIDFPRSLPIAGAIWNYERSQQGFAAPDKLRCSGPTNEPLYLSLFLQDDNVGIEYEYSLPADKDPPRDQQYNWVHEAFTTCSATCGGGFQTRNVSCRSREELDIVDESLCDEGLKPVTNQTCNIQECAAQWVPGPWSQCSKRCGKGGTKSREVHCQKIITNGFPSIVADKDCFEVLGPKPELFQKCNEDASCPTWFTGHWKSCDKLSGEGTRTRQVVCYQKNGNRVEVLGDEECEGEKPVAEEKCMLKSDVGVDWVLSEWTGCDSCVSSFRTRYAQCVTKTHKVLNDTFCAHHQKPLTQEPCDPTKLPACDAQWYATQWSKCSAECGMGVQSRRVFCGIFDGASVLKVDDSRCKNQTKYNDTKPCEIPKDKCPSKWFTGPWSECTNKCHRERQVMCLKDGETEATDCDGESVPDDWETCDTGLCGEDDLMPVKSTAVPEYDELEDCVEEGYSEVGLDVDPAAGFASTLHDMMLSDSPSTSDDGSGLSPTFGDLESEFSIYTESSGVSELEGSGSLTTYTTDTSDYDTTFYDESTTDFTSTTESVSTESTPVDKASSTETGETEMSSVSSNTESASTDTSGSTEETTLGSTDETTSESSEETTTGSTEESTSESTEVTTSGSTEETTTAESSKETSESSSTDESTESGSTDTSESTVETTESGSTTAESSQETSDSSSAVETTSPGSTETSETTIETTELISTTEESSEETSESSSTDETTASGSTDTSESTVETTESGSTTAESSSETSESSSTDETTASEFTDTSESTIETTESGSTTAETSQETSESSSTVEATASEFTETSESTVETTESASTPAGSTQETSESSSTDETTASGSAETSESTVETTESGSTTMESSQETSETSSVVETTVSESTEASETTVETTESGSTTAESSQVTSETSSIVETTVSGSTEASETTDDTTESASTPAGSSYQTTESTIESSSTVASESTQETSEGSSTETTETSVTETTDSGSTESTDTTTLETGYSTATAETTESGSTESTEETETTVSSSSTENTMTSSGITHWDLSSTVEVYTKRPKCRLRKKSCSKSYFGCCPDGRKPAAGPFDEGCDPPKTCKDTKYLCCPDKVSPALGPDYQGCPITACNDTLFGCCLSDNKTAAEGNDQEGCPPPPPACRSSEYGCCIDGETEASGPEKEGCPETFTSTTPAEETTVIVEGCASAKFGCCYDNETEATGPDSQGCPCNATEYGCYSDVATTGSPTSCHTSEFGCCPDDKTPAHGPDSEGCCLLYAFGCCPDNYMPARGPHLEGCGCESSRFGCCPDNETTAAGPNNKGCGCEHTEHGCCPDRHTEASGPDFDGCACHTYQFGCCPDGVTIAKGPNSQGCHCRQSINGCCGDGETAASGPNMEGCDCSSSKYGCCPDGQTEATGPKFLGCTDIPENRQAGCSLSTDRGTCRNYTVYWYYDTVYGGCSRFWYGGCEGNGNRFNSKEECEDVCVQPPPKDACKLPKVKGACVGYNVRWYFDYDREQCSQFIFGGCLGNANNFDSRELCQSQCEPERTTDQCSLPIERGSCSGNYLRWGFNKETRGCEQFTWGGCEGNANRFSSEAACLHRCDPPGVPKPVCAQPQEAGNCSETQAVWSFSQTENRCMPYYYTGCGGNENMFEHRETCEQTCPSAYVPELCALPAETGNCSNYRQKWYYNTAAQRCHQFYYGGCGGNQNNFDSQEECESRCSELVTTTVRPQPTPEIANRVAEPHRSEFCFLEKDPGPCTQFKTHWAYDYDTGKCVSFNYGGCGGNRNNFPSEDYCQYYCKPTQDVCQLPMQSGPCDDSQMRWFYDSSTDSCSQFTYGGCEGNENRFGSREDCESRCRTGPPQVASTPNTTLPPSTTTVAPVASGPRESIPQECQVSPTLEECSGAEVVWYFDQSRRECVSFENTESGVTCRRTGVFTSQEACERSCGAFRNINVCLYERDPGPCLAVITKYYFNAASGQCEEFIYGGCLGGPNRFSSQDECMHTCKTDKDPCKQSPEPGNCFDRIIQWYYDEPRDQCNQFIYRGCGGNDNRFETREDCEGRCKHEPSAEVTTTTTTSAPTPESVDEECRTPSSLEPCGSNITVYYYNEASRSCVESDIGGCRYANSYRSEEECERRCGAFRGLNVCGAHLDPGPCRASFPKLYWDAASGSCKPFTYGGCHGGPNRFSTVDECEEVCAATGPARACLQAVATGNVGCGAAPSRRWHYSEAHADCLVFAYQGCGGNGNNFQSYQLCTELCKVARTPDSNEILLECDRFAEECYRISCEYGVNRTRTAEGCERCICLEPAVDCEPARQECEAIQCPYGVQKTVGDDGCDSCKCFEDPCATIKCTAAERCIVDAFRDLETQDPRYIAKCIPESNEIPLECDEFTEECYRISCVYGVNRTRTAEGCERCTCLEPAVDCEPARQECEAIQCPYGVQRNVGDDGCERCKCSENPCASINCTASERCTVEAISDPETREPRYTAKCTPVIEMNKVLPNCDGFDDECSRIRCAYGVQRTRTVDGCERCSCVPVDIDCEPLKVECERLKCHYGLAKTIGDDGCERCKCLEHPCSNKQCPAGERCVPSPYRDPLTGDTKYSTDCRNVNKPGACPAEEASSTEGACSRECNDDADCRGVGKCCAHGCGRACLAPAPAPAPLLTTHAPDLPQAPRASIETEPEVRGAEGGKATLRCIFHGNPPPKITWRRGEITIDGEHDRYRLLSDDALEIVSLYRNDSGVYICIADNGLGTARQEIRLQVNDPVDAPVGIAGDENAVVTGELDRPMLIRCQAYGYPEPSVFWYRGLNGPMVPFSSALYEARNSVLLIRRLTIETLGEYACQAYNGVGKAAVWLVVVRAYQPDYVIPSNRYIVQRERVAAATTREPATETTTTTTTTTTPEPEIELPPFIVPVDTRIVASSTTLNTGSELSLPCEVDGYPEPDVYWTKDGARLTPSDRMWLTGTRLTIPQVTTSDSGLYGCHASNAYSSHYSTVQIDVQSLYIPAKCTDNPFFANCHLIVQSKFCQHKYYSKFCCKSCVEAGQLDPQDAELQADQPFTRKK